MGALVIVAIAIIFNLTKILDFLERQRNRRVEFIKDALKIDAVSDTSKSFLEEELNYLIFKKVTGISADKVFREKIKEIIEKASGELQIFDIARARQHLSIKNGKVVVTLDIWDKVGFLFNWLMAAFMVFFALLVLALPTIIKGLTFYQFSVFFSVGVVLLFFALFLAGQTRPYSAAKRIAPLVNKY